MRVCTSTTISDEKAPFCSVMRSHGSVIRPQTVRLWSEEWATSSTSDTAGAFSRFCHANNMQEQRVKSDSGDYRFRPAGHIGGASLPPVPSTKTHQGASG